MSHRFAALVIVLGVVLCAVSGAALWVGVTDALVALSGPMRRVPASELGGHPRGWFEVSGCVRHDLAVVVARGGEVYRLGEKGPSPDDDDRVYTPISEREDCDDERLPRRIFALVEDADSATTTLNRAATLRVAPPSIPAAVRGTIGPRIGIASNAAKARKKLPPDLAGRDDAPLLRKDAHPVDLWVSSITAGAGVHGLLLLWLGGRYLRRRARRREELRTGQVDDAEEAFFRTETLD